MAEPASSTAAARIEPLAGRAAQAIFDGFARYNEDFRNITRSTRRHFERRDWHGARRAAHERIALYDQAMAATISSLRQILGGHFEDEVVWARCKLLYLELLGDSIDRELNKTFFNSLSRRIFRTVGVNGHLEFVGADRGPTDHVSDQVSIRSYPFDGGLGATCRRLLEDYSVDAPWRDLGGCAAYVHGELRRQLARRGGTGAIERIELVEPLFFRNTRAFIVGRILLSDAQVPFLVAMVHHSEGVMVDRVLTSMEPASNLFSYSRSYFHVDVATVGDTVVFLHKIMPRKPVEELYAALGRAKQAKTERYRSIVRHLARHDEPFVVAPGSKGMVMAVFTLPSLDVVFKVIRDRFAPPKTVTREEVMRKYEMVYMHDRAGRLVDAQEFKSLEFDRRRFTPEVLEELLGECSETVRLDGDTLLLGHVYVERRLMPLNLFLAEADEEAAEAVIIDYGLAIKNLAATNIFPGDLLLKNFGVSSQGRVIFYDYDELCAVTDCRFRKLPRPRNEIEAMSGEVWFDVGPDDVFPEQFVSFLGLQPEHLKIFREHHGEVLTPRFWKRMQERLRAGEIFDIAPYTRGRTGL